MLLGQHIPFNVGKYSIEDLELLEKTIQNYDKLKQRIAERKADYERELQSGKDLSGDRLSKTNAYITANLYNFCVMLEAHDKDPSDPPEPFITVYERGGR